MSDETKKRRFIKRHYKFFKTRDTSKSLWALELDLKNMINKSKKKSKEV